MTEDFLKAIETCDLPALGPEQRASAKPSLALEVIDAFSMPRARFDKQRRTLVADSTAPALHAPAPAKSAMHALRLAMVEQRVRRHHMFKPPVLADGITPRECLQRRSDADAWRQRRFERVQMEGTRDPRRGGSGTTR